MSSHKLAVRLTRAVIDNSRL